MGPLIFHKPGDVRVPAAAGRDAVSLNRNHLPRVLATAEMVRKWGQAKISNRTVEDWICISTRKMGELMFSSSRLTVSEAEAQLSASGARHRFMKLIVFNLATFLMFAIVSPLRAGAT